MTTPRVGLIGYPIGNSLSPLLHQTLFRLTGVAATYELWEFPPDQWPVDFKQQLKRDWLGLNVTTPYKELAYGICDHFSEAAMQLGAVNHLRVRPDGLVIGDNKDVDGAYFTLQGIAAANKEQPPTWLKDIHLIGLGPAGRSVLMAHLRFWRAERARLKASKVRGIPPGTATLWVREIRPAHEEWVRNLKPMLEGVIDLQLESLAGLPLVPVRGLLINAAPRTEFSPLAELPQGNYGVWDLNYGQPIPPLVAQARAAGLYAIDGLPMLVWQGFFSAARWFPQEIRPQEHMGLTKELLDTLRRALTEA